MVPAEPRVHPVGRLDMDTEGLLLLTNDGELTHRLTHPSFGVHKEYLAEVHGVPSRTAVRALREGVELEDGPTAPAVVSSPAPGMLRIVIHEGRNRQVRRMCEAVGHPVIRLVRTRIGPLRDQQLAPGEWRELDIDEVRAWNAPPGPVASGRMRRRPAASLVRMSWPSWRCAARSPSSATIVTLLDRVERLLDEMLERNGVTHDDLVSILFTATPDLHSVFPAAAARRMGLGDVPLICAQELDIDGGMPRCIRVLMHLTTTRPRSELRHVYLEDARSCATTCRMTAQRSAAPRWWGPGSSARPSASRCEPAAGT